LVYGGKYFFILRPLIYGNAAGTNMKRMEEIQGTKQSYEDILSNRNVPEH
jgi:hypothetical protein